MVIVYDWCKTLTYRIGQLTSKQTNILIKRKEKKKKGD